MQKQCHPPPIASLFDSARTSKKTNKKVRKRKELRTAQSMNQITDPITDWLTDQLTNPRIDQLAEHRNDQRKEEGTRYWPFHRNRSLARQPRAMPSKSSIAGTPANPTSTTAKGTVETYPT